MQGSGSHSFTLISQFSPVIPGTHTHLYLKEMQPDEVTKHTENPVFFFCFFLDDGGCDYQLRKILQKIYDMIYLFTAIGLTPGSSSTVHIYTQTIHRTTQWT